MLVTVDRYRALTRDVTTHADVITERLDEAVELLEEALDRPLAMAERTETMFPTRDGAVNPRATPITAVTGWTIDGERLLYGNLVPIGNVGLPDNPGFDLVTGGPVLGWYRPPRITYTGGWVERSANPTATNRLPRSIERDLAWAAWRLGRVPAPIAADIPAGATSVTLGDASISFGPDGAAADPSETSEMCWSPETLRYRYRPPRGV